MVKRKRIGLIFSYTEEWIAGTYYILNIINSFHTLPRSKKPVVVVISEDVGNFSIVQKETNYPYLEFVQIPIQPPKYSSAERILNTIGFKLGMKKIVNKEPLKANVDILYPFAISDITATNVAKVNWVPDFQEVHLPHLFTSQIIEQRRKHHEEVVCKGDWVVFSSLDSQKDFNSLYPKAKLRQFVLPFSVTHPNFERQVLSELLLEYNLSDLYFFAPNQFWAHKNHMVILKAIKDLKDQNVEVQVAFSGKENDHRNTDYIASLKSFIHEEELESNVRFLGFIPREEQLKLMEQAIAIVQPSKFEGWSTVVEDAKALNQHIVLSNINVHQEQINENVTFFDSDDFKNLGVILNTYWQERPVVTKVNYSLERKKFAENFMILTTSIMTKNNPEMKA